MLCKGGDADLALQVGRGGTVEGQVDPQVRVQGWGPAMRRACGMLALVQLQRLQLRAPVLLVVCAASCRVSQAGRWLMHGAAVWHSQECGAKKGMLVAVQGHPLCFAARATQAPLAVAGRLLRAARTHG